MSPAEGLAITCPRCGSELPAAILESNGINCSVCETHAQAVIFPAMFRRVEAAGDEIVVAGESTCYFHGDRVAAVACVRCGRFLCQLCRINWDGEDVCPACLEASNDLKTAKPVSSCYRSDSLALAISVLPMVTVFLTILTAPIALGIAIFTFRKRCSIAPRSKARFVAAIVISLAQIMGWAVFFVYSFRQRMGG